MNTARQVGTYICLGHAGPAHLPKKLIYIELTKTLDIYTIKHTNYRKNTLADLNTILRHFFGKKLSLGQHSDSYSD